MAASAGANLPQCHATYEYTHCKQHLIGINGRSTLYDCAVRPIWICYFATRTFYLHKTLYIYIQRCFLQPCLLICYALRCLPAEVGPLWTGWQMGAAGPFRARWYARQGVTSRRRSRQLLSRWTRWESSHALSGFLCRCSGRFSSRVVSRSLLERAAAARADGRFDSDLLRRVSRPRASVGLVFRHILE